MNTLSANHARPRLLVTGQFWHAEFADLVNGLTVPTTLLRDHRLPDASHCDTRFDLILVCRERRGSVSQATVDRLAQLFPGTPIVALLGSLCEGEFRSGQPLQGVQSLFWHQWQGQYDQLATLVGSRALPVRTPADLPVQPVELGPVRPETAARFAVSAYSRTQYEMLADAITALGGETVWLEQMTWNAEPLEGIAAVCVDGDSLTANFEKRLGLVRSFCESTPLVCVLGFPRKQEVQELKQRWGVRAVLSRPFELAQLHWALREATGVELPNAPQPQVQVPFPVSAVQPVVAAGWSTVSR